MVSTAAWNTHKITVALDFTSSEQTKTKNRMVGWVALLARTPLLLVPVVAAGCVGAVSIVGTYRASKYVSATVLRVKTEQQQVRHALSINLSYLIVPIPTRSALCVGLWCGVVWCGVVWSCLGVLYNWCDGVSASAGTFFIVSRTASGSTVHL